MSFSEERSEFPAESSQGWLHFVPDASLGLPADDGFLARLSEEVARELDRLREEKREGELRLTRRVSAVALDCARALDGMERELDDLADIRRQDLQARLETLRSQVYGHLAEALDRARHEPMAGADPAMN